ncbi:hypothetical protein J6590_002959 [Homalodisca vitripennis]|nr:hypothetical protein J6590_002959 [Homalodisca vitripennis]
MECGGIDANMEVFIEINVVMNCLSIPPLNGQWLMVVNPLAYTVGNHDLLLLVKRMTRAVTSLVGLPESRRAGRRTVNSDSEVMFGVKQSKPHLCGAEPRAGLVTRHAVVLRHSPRGTSPNTGNLGLLSPRRVPAVTVPVHPRVIPFPPAGNSGLSWLA